VTTLNPYQVRYRTRHQPDLPTSITDREAPRRAGGAPARPFLHGLCTFGWLGSILDRAAGPGRQLRSLAGRFTAPVFPGRELVVEARLTDREGIATVRSGDRALLGPAMASFVSRTKSR
jgi:acyl dehydratase